MERRGTGVGVGDGVGANEEVERWSALPGRCPSRRGREADEMREVERDRSRTPLPAQRVKRTG
jgi:hypothetical protein